MHDLYVPGQGTYFASKLVILIRPTAISNGSTSLVFSVFPITLLPLDDTTLLYINIPFQNPNQPLFQETESIRSLIILLCTFYPGHVLQPLAGAHSHLCVSWRGGIRPQFSRGGGF